MQGIRSVNWYDTYDFKQLAVVGTAYDLPPVPEGGTITPAALSKNKGAVTGSLEVVEDLSGLHLITVNYYDDPRRRLLCTVSDNHLGGRNNLFIGYTFNDEISEKIETHYVNGQQNDQIVLITRYTYDHQGRLLEEMLKFDDEDFITISALEYNEIGDVINTYLHGGDNVQAFNQKIESTYNIRGWLRKLNDPAEIGYKLFALDLRYENPTTGGNIDATNRFNGNISQMHWNSKNDIQRAYGFEYDRLNRLTDASYGDGSAGSNNPNFYGTAFDYDVNGNITNLQRNMDNTLIDNLSYSYYSNGNRLKSVDDASGNTAGYAPNTGQYLYDANANMTYDPSKKITISYNPLNLPSLVEFDNSDFIEYTYTATGTKLRKTVTSWKTTAGGTTDYSGQFLYQDNELSCIFTPVGRIVPMQYNDETFWKHEYNLKDHLGNTRIVFAAHPHGQPEVMQQTSYYSFGMTLQQQNFGGALNQPNKLLYNGKELQDDELAGVSLDWYDYGARYYDPALGRWHVVDPMAHEREWLSPYNFCSLNPISRTDPTGALDDWYETPEGEKKYDENIHSAKDMKEKGIEGKYLGKTYKEGDNYYSLFGQIKDLKTMEGKLYEKIDQTLTNYANYIKEYDQSAWEEPIERSADFNIGVPFKKNAFGFSDYNDYTFSYEGATGYYQVYGDPSAMRGKLDWGKDTYSANKNYGFGNMKPGYNTHIYVSKSPRLDIVTLVFPTLNSKKTLYNKWKNEFFPDKK
jgi:RHS repeat-associated protein